jgi:hypothetical protein
MGNVNSTKETKTNFGSIYPKENDKPRPGYYFNVSKKMYQGNEISILPDEDSFKKLKYGYAKSNLRVFYKGVPIQDANPKTFSIISRSNVANIIDNSEQLVKLNSVLGMDYNCNKKRLYFHGNIIYKET